MAELLSRVTERVESQEAFCLVLMRVDDYDEYRTIMGRLESDRQFRALYELIRGGLSEGWFVGRFSSDSLCVYAPGLSPEDGLARAENWRNQAAKRLRQTASFGVAYYPCGPFSPLEIMANAQKALEHASFFGPASTALFDSVSLNISGDKRFEVGDQEGAIAEYLKALELNPQDLNVLNSLGVCYGYQRNVDLAMQTFSRVLELDPQNLMAHYNQGFVLAMSGRLNEALDSLRQAARIDARQFDVLFQLGKTALALDLIEEALENFKRAAALKDHRPIVYRYLGQTLLKAERPDEAMDAFKAAVRYDPEDAPSLSQLGVLYMERTTDTDVALSLLKQSAAQDPANVHFRQRLARALAKAGKPVSSEMEYRQVLDMGAKSREVFFELGEVIREQGRDDEAEHFYRAALDVDPEFRPAQTALRQIGV
jgi:tetratricopeptide (TPR) repeat protein